MIVTTINVKSYKRDVSRLHALRGYSMRRYAAAWAQRQHAAAERYFYAAERCGRLLRILGSA